MSDFRTTYIKYFVQISQILRDPTEEELVACLPIFHKPVHGDGTPLTPDEYRKLAVDGWKAKQAADIVKLLMELQPAADPTPAPATEAQLISMGMDLGVYAMSKLFAGGKYQFTPEMWDKFGWNAAQSLERETGKPAEDLVMTMVPIIEAAINKVGGNA